MSSSDVRNHEHREKRGIWAYYSIAPGAMEQAACLTAHVPIAGQCRDIVLIERRAQAL